MKKLNFLSFVAMLAAVSFTSCKDVVTTPTTVDLMPKAIITGYVTAQLDTNSVALEAAPTTTQILVEVNYSDIKAGATGKWQDTVSVDADGKFTTSIPTDANGVTAYIIPLPFEYNQVQAYGDFWSTIKKPYTLAMCSLTVVKSGETRFKDLAYIAAKKPSDIAYKVSVTGTVKAETDDTKTGLEKVTNKSNAIAVTVNGIETKTNIDSNGNFSIEIPKGVAATYKVDFTNDKLSGGITTFGRAYSKIGSIAASTGPVLLNIVAE